MSTAILTRAGPPPGADLDDPGSTPVADVEAEAVEPASGGPSWTRDGNRHVCTGPAGVVGWYEHIGSWWAAFTPGRHPGPRYWSERLAESEAEARQLVERRCTP